MEKKNHTIVSPRNPHRPKRTTPNRQIPTRVSNIPSPLNGSSYSKTEVIDILEPYNEDKRSTIRSRMITKMVAAGHVKGGRSTLYRDLKIARMGRVIKHSHFATRGKLRLLSDRDVNCIKDKINKYDGRAYGVSEIKQLMIEQVMENVINSGNIPLTNAIDPSSSSVMNYTALLAYDNSISIDGSKAISKTNNRFTAENSIIASILYVIAVAYSHYIPCEVEDSCVKKDMEDAPIGVRMMYTLTQKALGGIPIRPIKPCYLFSTDDTVVYTFEGKGDKETYFRLCSKNSTTSAGYSSK